MKTMFKLSFSLAAYAVVACVGLALVYQATAPLIAAAAERETQAALKVVFPEAASFEAVPEKLESGVKNITFDKAYLAKSGTDTIGMVIQVTGPTYGSSTLAVGVDTEGKLKALRFLANTDTPGLGTKTAQSPFIDQFTAKSAKDNFKVGQDVVAISGATISSKAVANLVKLAATKADAFLAAR